MPLPEMPSRKRPNLSRVSSDARRMKASRLSKNISREHFGSGPSSSSVGAARLASAVPDVIPAVQPQVSGSGPSVADFVNPVPVLSTASLLNTRIAPPRNLLHLGFNYQPNCDYSAHPMALIGKLDKICPHCCARKFRSEAPGLCCAGGKVCLPPLVPPSEPLASLVAGVTAESKHFLVNIRKYNSCFQMTSFGATRIIQGDGYVPSFKVQGQVYHQVGSLLPVADREPTFLQIYFMGDRQQEADQRRRFISGTRESIVLALQDFLHEHNLLVRCFKTALDRMPSDEYVVVIRPDRAPAGQHAGRYNAPTSDEVAVVMVGEQFNSRDIVIQRREGALRRICDTNRSYDALQYPILFWQGEDGYHFGLRMRDPATYVETPKKVSAMNYYAYRLMIRDPAQNHILRCGRVFQQYAVDMYVKIESERLLYIRLNQTQLRAEEYGQLRDAIRADANVNPQDLGRRVILPATFVGSPRHMAEYTQDALTYVRVHGRPDLFLTFTCNPSWNEIKELLLPGQVAADRPDISARVFKQKLTTLLAFMVKHRVFGRVTCWMYSIEFQKRGLPHSHILVWLEEKLRPSSIDSVISAEIPDVNVDKELYDIVTRHMIHGPCGSLNPNRPCMKDGKCEKNFPRR